MVFGILIFVLLKSQEEAAKSKTTKAIQAKKPRKIKKSKKGKHQHINIETEKFGNWFEIAQARKTKKSKIKKTIIKAKKKN